MITTKNQTFCNNNIATTILHYNTNYLEVLSDIISWHYILLGALLSVTKTTRKNDTRYGKGCLSPRYHYTTVMTTPPIEAACTCTNVVKCNVVNTSYKVIVKLLRLPTS